MRFIFLVLLGLGIVSCAEIVEPDPAAAIEDKFFAALRIGDSKTALAQFDPAFEAEQPNWPKLLSGLHTKFGPITSVTLNEAQLAADDDAPCFLLAYSVQRLVLASNERLFVCRESKSARWLIAGHEFNRLDNGKSISAGKIPTIRSASLP